MAQYCRVGRENLPGDIRDAFPVSSSHCASKRACRSLADVTGSPGGGNERRSRWFLWEGKKVGDDTMLTKSRLAIAAALLLGAASAAQAANDNQSDPTRGFP
jgi:hypothetical protein